MKELMERIQWQCRYEKRLLESMMLEIENLPQGYLVPKKIKGKAYTYIRKRRNNKDVQLFDTMGQPVIASGEGDFFTDKIVSMENWQEAEGILRRRFLEKSRKKLEKSIFQTEKFLKAHVLYDPQEIYDSIWRGDLSIKMDKYQRGDCKAKLKQSSDHHLDNEFLPEGKKHLTPKGIRVRSKSEALIAGMLEIYGLDYQYESRLLLDGKVFYPDFTLWNNRFDEFVYWEHFGLTHDLEYRRSMNEKLRIYEKNGIIPWKNLIITYDSEEGHIDMKHIQMILCNIMGLQPLL